MSIKRVILLTALFALILGSISCYSDRDPHYGAKTYKTGQSTDFDSVVHTGDGGFIAAGTVNQGTSGYINIWVTKLNDEGDPQWEKSYGGDSIDDSVDHLTIMEIPSTGYMVTARSKSFTGSMFTLWMIKIDLNGNLLWQKAFDGGHDFYPGKCVAAGNGYAISGSMYIDGEQYAALLRVTSDGDVEWMKKYSFTIAHSLKKINGGFIVAGLTRDGDTTGYYDGVLMRTDETGTPAWYRQYGQEDRFCQLFSVDTALDGSIMAAGSIASWNGNSSDQDYWVMRCNPDNGAITWQKAYNAGGADEKAQHIEFTVDDSFVLTGHSNARNTSDVLSLKIHNNGSIQWQKLYNVGNAYGSEIHPTSYGFVMAGRSNSSALLIGVDNNGAIEGSDIDSNASCSVYNTAASSVEISVNHEIISISTFTTSGEVRSTSADIKFY